jgi:AcrR family transcriptional regulator
MENTEPRTRLSTEIAGPLRADARRNRARVLEAAHAVFAAHGVGVPLGQIARRAGVGAGTVYRHFPSKESLVEAVLVDSIDQLVDEARALAADPLPGQTFFDFFSRMVERALFNKLLCDAMEAGALVRLKRGSTHQEAFRAALGALIARAQREGAVREDLDANDVAALMAGCVAMEHNRASPGRMTAIASVALRPVPPVPVTKPSPSFLSRDETESPRNETRAGSTPACEVCGAPIPIRATGRPARFCSGACRQSAHRRRQARLTASGRRDV